MPGQEEVGDFVRRAGDLGELGAVGDECRVQLDTGGDAIAIGFQAVLQGKFVGGEGLVIGVASAAAWQGVRVAGEAGFERGKEAGGEAFVASAEVDVFHDAISGGAMVGFFGDLD